MGVVLPRENELPEDYHRRHRTKQLADSLYKTPPVPLLMSRVLLVISPCPAHNDSCVCGVAAAPRPACPLQQRKESPHEDHPPDDPVTAAHARRHADSQLLAPYHRWLSALRRP